MKRALVLAAAGLCVATAAHAQGTSKKYDWNDSANQTCMEPYAPAIPKPEETSLKDLIEEVKPEVKTFIDESNQYLECLGVQMAKAKEEGDKERIKKLIKAHNENVDYQKSVAGEFNATLNKLKKKAGLVGSEEAGQKPASAKEPENTEGSEASEEAKEAESAASEGSKEAAEADQTKESSEN